MVIAKWKCSEVETLQLLYHAVIQLCQCLQGRLSFKCVWHGAITPLISFYPLPPLFVSVSLTFPSSSFAPQISSFVWKVTKQLRQIYAVLAVPPLFLLPSLFYLTRLSLLFSTLSLSLISPPVQTLALCLAMPLSFLGTSPALDYPLRVILLVELSPSCCLKPWHISQLNDDMKKAKTMCILQKNTWQSQAFKSCCAQRSS